MTITLSLSAIGLLIFLDFLNEVYSGMNQYDLIEAFIIEGGILTTITLTIRYIWNRFQNETHDKDSIHQDLLSIKDEVEKWKEMTQFLSENYRIYVEQQMEKWGFTKTEKEIAHYLLKGLSSKEMATLRNSSDRTIRNHCQVIYQKSNLKGKSEFMAFFLEKILK